MLLEYATILVSFALPILVYILIHSKRLSTHEKLIAGYFLVFAAVAALPYLHNALTIRVAGKAVYTTTAIVPNITDPNGSYAVVNATVEVPVYEPYRLGSVYTAIYAVSVMVAALLLVAWSMICYLAYGFGHRC